MLRFISMVVLGACVGLCACAPDALSSHAVDTLRHGLTQQQVQQRLDRSALSVVTVQFQRETYMAELYPLEKGKGWKEVAPVGAAPAVSCAVDGQFSDGRCDQAPSDFPDVQLTDQPLVVVYQVRGGVPYLQAWGTVQSGLFQRRGGANISRALWGKINVALLPNIEKI